MLYNLLAIGFICLVLGLAVIRHCSIYSPLMINALVWLLVFATGLTFQERFYPLQERAFIAWMLWFIVTSLIFFLLYPSRMNSARKGYEIRRIPIDYTLLLILLILWLAYRIWVVGSTGPETFFLNLRWSNFNLEGFTPYGLIRRFYPLIFALFLFEHVYAHEGNRHLRLLLWFWMLLYAFSTMGKIQIMTPVLSWIIIEGIKGKTNARGIALLTAIVFALAMSMHFIREGFSDKSIIGDLFAIYIYSPLVAFGYMDIDCSMPFGAYVFRFFYAAGNILGIAPQPTSLILPYIEVPMLTNVYTVMHPFYHDFGMLGILLEAAIYGFFFSCLYFLSVKRGGLWLVLFSGYSIILVGQFIVELLITLFSGNLQFFIYTLTIFLASRKICYVS